MDFLGFLWRIWGSSMGYSQFEKIFPLWATRKRPWPITSLLLTRRYAPLPTRSREPKYITQVRYFHNPMRRATWQRRDGSKALQRKLDPPLYARRESASVKARTRAGDITVLSCAMGAFDQVPHLHFELPEPGRPSMPAPPGSKIQSAASLKGPVIATAPAGQLAGFLASFRSRRQLYFVLFGPMLSTFRKEIARY